MTHQRLTGKYSPANTRCDVNVHSFCFSKALKIRNDSDNRFIIGEIFPIFTGYKLTAKNEFRRIS